MVLAEWQVSQQMLWTIWFTVFLLWVWLLRSPRSSTFVSEARSPMPGSGPAPGASVRGGCLDGMG